MALTNRMVRYTKEQHNKSDKQVNAKLALVLTSPALYGEALSLFEPIYAKIEHLLLNDGACCDHPQLRKVAPLLAKLQRTSSFRADMAFYMSADHRAQIDEIRGAGRPIELAKYLKRLNDLAEKDPVAILSYVFHMYSAIFAGGFILKRIVSKAMGLPRESKEGLQTFCLDESCSDSPKRLTRELKRILNEEIELSEEEARRCIEEGLEVFRLNDALVATVQGTDAWKNAKYDFCKRWIARPLVAAAGFAIVTYYVWRISGQNDIIVKH